MHELVVSKPDQTMEFCGLKSRIAMNFIIFDDCILFVIVVICFVTSTKTCEKSENEKRSNNVG